jgi:hypothetical protein
MNLCTPTAAPVLDLEKVMKRCYMKLFFGLLAVLNVTLLFNGNFGIVLISCHSELIWLENCL